MMLSALKHKQSLYKLHIHQPTFYWTSPTMSWVLTLHCTHVGECQCLITVDTCSETLYINFRWWFVLLGPTINDLDEGQKERGKGEKRKQRKELLVGSTDRYA